MSKTNLPPRVFLQTFSGSLANKALFQERMRGKRTAVFTNHWNHRLSLKTLKRNPQNSLQNQTMADSFFCTYPLHSSKLLFFSIFQCFQISITKPVRVCNHVHYQNFSLTNFFFSVDYNFWCEESLLAWIEWIFFCILILNCTTSCF